MDSIVGWKRLDIVLKRMGRPWADETRDLFLRRAKMALKKYYWDKLNDDVSKERLTKPLSDIADYVHKAFNAHLEKDLECLYAGTIFLDSILKETGRRFTSDIKEANILSDVGKRLANHFWKELEASKADPSAYEHAFHTLVDSLLEAHHQER